MIQIPQSTSRVVMLKLFLSGTTTAATSKTVAVTISKAGGAFGNPNAGATNATEVSSGWYKVTLDTTDTGTVGDLVVRGTASGCDDSERVFGVVSAASGGLTNLDAAVSAVKSKTDNLPSDPADASDIAASFSTVNATLSTIAGYIDTEVAAIKLKTDNLPAAPAAVGDIPTAAQILAAGDVDGYTLEQALKLCLAALAGKLSGAAGTTVTIRAADDSKDRVVATVDSNGNRSSVTLDATG